MRRTTSRRAAGLAFAEGLESRRMLAANLFGARSGAMMSPIDNVPPTVERGAFRFDATPQSIQFTFSEQVQNLDNSDLVLHNRSTNTTLPPGSINLASYDPATFTATFTFNTPGGMLDGGTYSATFNEAGVQDLDGNSLVGGFDYEFLYVAGTAGDDTFYAVQGDVMLFVWVNADPQIDSPTYGAVFPFLDHLSFDGFGGDDVLTLDFAGGDVRPPGDDSFGYRLGVDDETLRLRGTIDWVFDTDPAPATPHLTVELEHGAAATFSGPATHLAALNLSGASRAVLAAGNSRILVVDGLSFSDNTSSLDLTDNDLMLRYAGPSPLPSTQALLNGGVIFSSTADENPLHNTTLGAMESSDYESIYGPGAPFAGEPITGPAVLIKYTYFGDADFNGRVNFDDFARTDSGFLNHRTGWLNGDFDGNGIVDFDDYALISLGFHTQGSAL